MLRHVKRCESESMAWSCFCLDSMVRGYHKYQAIWSDLYVGEELICEREVGNSHDPQAVALKKEIDGDLRIVGHIPRKISSSCSIFIWRGGSIKCSITGSRRGTLKRGKIWRIVIWRICSHSPNFPDAKVSLRTVTIVDVCT